MNDSNRRRETSDIHRFLTQQARMKASRLEEPEAPVSSQGLRHAIDLLRHDDLSTTRTQQLIERFHREQDNTRTRVDQQQDHTGPMGGGTCVNPSCVVNLELPVETRRGDLLLALCIVMKKNNRNLKNWRLWGCLNR